jgi:hypothetical protein
VTEPTALDIDNARRRQEIADRFRAQAAQTEALACSLFGTGWKPTGYHYLVEKDAEDQARRSGTKPTPSATVISVEKGGMKRHFRVETMTECDTPLAGFGDMLMEPHPTRGFDHGQRVSETLEFHAFRNSRPGSRKKIQREKHEHLGFPGN